MRKERQKVRRVVPIKEVRLKQVLVLKQAQGCVMRAKVMMQVAAQRQIKPIALNQEVVLPVRQPTPSVIRVLRLKQEGKSVNLLLPSKMKLFPIKHGIILLPLHTMHEQGCMLVHLLMQIPKEKRTQMLLQGSKDRINIMEERRAVLQPKP